MSAAIGYIPAVNIHYFAQSLNPLLLSALAKNGGEETLEQVVEKFARGQYYLLARVEDEQVTAFVILSVLPYAAMRSLLVAYAGGRNATKDLFPHVVAAARELRCARVEALTDAAGARLSRRFGFDTARHFVTLEIDSNKEDAS